MSAYADPCHEANAAAPAGRWNSPHPVRAGFAGRASNISGRGKWAPPQPESRWHEGGGGGDGWLRDAYISALSGREHEEGSWKAREKQKRRLHGSFAAGRA
jgi:hypothetical protein